MNVELLELTPVEHNVAPWCIDGRPAPRSEPGPSMLGGSIQPILFSAIAHGNNFDFLTVIRGISDLRANGFSVGVHRGEKKNPISDLNISFTNLATKEIEIFSDADHRAHGIPYVNPSTNEPGIIPVNAKVGYENGVSDCGFADKLEAILDRTLDKRTEITKRLIDVLGEDSQTGINKTFDTFDKWYSKGRRIQISGEKLISLFEDHEANILEVEGEHIEVGAVVNIDENTTVDTNAAHDEGHPVFNLDVPAGEVQSESLGVDPEFSRYMSLILLQATAMVLVEDKGKEQLDVYVNLPSTPQ